MRWVVSLAAALVICAGCDGPAPTGMDAGVEPDAFSTSLDAGPPPEPVPLPIDLRCATSLPYRVSAIEYAPDGSIYVLGLVDTDVDFDPGPAVEPYVVPAMGVSQSLVAAFDENCTYRWTRVFDEATRLVGMGVDASGTIVVSGAVAHDPFGDPLNVDFDPTSGNDRRTAKNVMFLSRLRPDGSYVSTSLRAWCSYELPLDGCDTAPLLLPRGTAVAPDGTAYVSTDREIIRGAADGTFGWPSLPPDAGVQTSGELELAPDGEVWVSQLLHGDMDWTLGVDSPRGNCRADDPTCIERFVLVGVEPDGSYGGSVSQPPDQIYTVTDFAIDGAGEFHLVGQFESGTSDSLAPDFDWSGNTERWNGRGFYGFAMAEDGELRWSTIYPVGQTTTATNGPLFGGQVWVDGSAGIVYRAGNFTASVATLTGGAFTDDNRYDVFLSAETVGGQPLWSTGLGAPSSPPGLQLLLAPGTAGRFVIAFPTEDADITQSVHPSSGQGLTLAVYEPETCTEGATRQSVCTGGTPATLTCTGGRWGPNTCDTAWLDASRHCEVTCEDLSSYGAACGGHDDGCGGSLACGTCAGPMVCGGAERTCRGPAGIQVIANDLNHPSFQMHLDATHVYVVTANDYVDGATGARPLPESIWRIARDGRGTPVELLQAGPNITFGVSGTHVYFLDPVANTLSRIPKDGSGPAEVLDSGLRNVGGVIVDGRLVYYTTEIAAEPVHYRWIRAYDERTGTTSRHETIGFEPDGFLADTTHIWVADSGGPMTNWYRWARGEVMLGPPEMMLTTRLAMLSVDEVGSVVYGTMPFENALYRQGFGTGSFGTTLVTMYARPTDMPSTGSIDGTSIWWVENGENAQHTWTGRVHHADLVTGQSTVAHSGLNHPVAIAGDADGLFVATVGDLTAHGTTGEVVRLW